MQNRVFVRNDLVERKIKSCRKSSKTFLEFKKKVRTRPWRSYLWRKRYHKGIVSCIWRRNNTFSKYKLGIEVDEYNHEGRNSEYEQSRQLMIESHGITIIRTNPDAADFGMNRLINQIYKH